MTSLKYPRLSRNDVMLAANEIVLNKCSDAHIIQFNYKHPFQTWVWFVSPKSWNLTEALALEVQMVYSYHPSPGMQMFLKEKMLQGYNKLKTKIKKI